jgi:hypothetical protein
MKAEVRAGLTWFLRAIAIGLFLFLALLVLFRRRR